MNVAARTTIGDDAGWRAAGRALSWSIAAAFLVATVIYLLVEFNFITPARRLDPSLDLVGRILSFFEYQARVWPFEMPANLLFGLGFFALAGLGVVLGRLLGEGVSATLGAAAVVAGGVLAGAAQLVYVGGAMIASDIRFLEPEHQPEQVISQGIGFDIVASVQSLLLAGAFVLLGTGMLLVAAAALAQGWPRRSWARLSQGLAAFLLLVGVVLVVAIVANIGIVVDVMVLVGGGILLPVWVIWLARELRTPEVGKAG